jgi:hypothetical protein
MNRREFDAVTGTLGACMRSHRDAGDAHAADAIAGLAAALAASLRHGSPGFDQDAFLARTALAAGQPETAPMIGRDGDARFSPDDLGKIAGTRALLLSGRGEHSRRRAGISRSEMAAVCGVADSMVSAWEAGQGIPDGGQALAYGRLLAARQPATEPGPEQAAGMVPDDATRDAVLANLVTTREASDRMGLPCTAMDSRLRRAGVRPVAREDGPAGYLYWWPDIPRRGGGDDHAGSEEAPGEDARASVLACLVTRGAIGARLGVPARTVTWLIASAEGFPQPVHGRGTPGERYWWPDVLRCLRERQRIWPGQPGVAVHVDTGGTGAPGITVPAPAALAFTVPSASPAPPGRTAGRRLPGPPAGQDRARAARP